MCLSTDWYQLGVAPDNKTDRGLAELRASVSHCLLSFLLPPLFRLSLAFGFLLPPSFFVSLLLRGCLAPGFHFELSLFLLLFLGLVLEYPLSAY